jgi:hypothetical protein
MKRALPAMASLGLVISTAPALAQRQRCVQLANQIVIFGVSGGDLTLHAFELGRRQLARVLLLEFQREINRVRIDVLVRLLGRTIDSRAWKVVLCVGKAKELRGLSFLVSYAWR